MIVKDRKERYKQKVKFVMESNSWSKIKTAIGTISIYKNPISIEVIDEKEVPEEFMRIKKEVDKTKIKNHFKETGEIVDGIKIINDKTSLKIK